MTVRLLADAEAELRAAAKAYAKTRLALAERFLRAVIEAQADIERHPLRFPPPVKVRTSRQIRRKLLKRFPYALIYEVKATEIIVLAVAHTSRRPGYWKTRAG